MNALYRHPSGICEPVALLMLDGQLCSPGGAPLQPTGGIDLIAGWGGMDGVADVHSDGVHDYLVPHSEPAAAEV